MNRQLHQYHDPYRKQDLDAADITEIFLYLSSFSCQFPDDKCLQPDICQHPEYSGQGQGNGQHAESRGLKIPCRIHDV